LSKSGLKLVCNVNFGYGNLKSENFQDYTLKTSTKLYIHEFGFWMSRTKQLTILCHLRGLH
jgi:hypothetical protein